MKKTKYNIILILTLFVLGFSACADKWEDHLKRSGQISDGTVLEQIQSNSQLSIFAGYLVETGYDKILASQNNYTVWAPTNDAFSSIDAALLNDSAQLRLIIGNHICMQMQMAQTINTAVKLYAINGKPIRWVPKSLTFENASITTANNVCENGVLHITDKVALPKPNLWELVNSSQIATAAPINSNFLIRYSYLFFDEANSTIKYVDPNTGKNVYDSVKYTVYRFLQNAADIRDEKMEFTYFILTDAALTQQATVYKSYCTQLVAANTDSVTWFNISKDYLFNSKITTIPDTLITTDGTKIPVDKASILDTIEASNGIMYVLNNSQVPLKNKVREFRMEGESAGRALFSNTRFDQYTNYKEIADMRASGYKYIWINNHNYADNYFYYTVNLFSCKYKVYWVAPFLNPAAGTNLNQQLTVTLNNIETNLGTKTQSNGFTELNFTDYTAPVFGNAVVKIKTATGVANQLSLDYVRFVPVLP